MKPIKTSELSGAALDWAVAVCELGADRVWWNRETHGTTLRGAWMCGRERHSDYERVPNYSTNWAQGGPIIERELISVSREFSSFTKGYEWAAWTPAPIRDDAEAFGYDPTALIAAMRCYVASKLGDTVEVPTELLTAAKLIIDILEH